MLLLATSGCYDCESLKQNKRVDDYNEYHGADTGRGDDDIFSSVPIGSLEMKYMS